MTAELDLSFRQLVRLSEEEKESAYGSVYSVSGPGNIPLG